MVSSDAVPTNPHMNEAGNGHGCVRSDRCQRISRTQTQTHTQRRRCRLLECAMCSLENERARALENEILAYLRAMVLQ